ncbi:hypothetical protein [Streptomyces scopuliridis]|uniref:hypothetical protein n=1 Tax=Streptomyces scopuliridis TaxID=452529 RepID=UPI0035D9638F
MSRTERFAQDIHALNHQLAVESRQSLLRMTLTTMGTREMGCGVDAELMALASTAGGAVVTAISTDVWERARSAVGALWRRAYPDRAETVEAELLETRELLLAAQGGTQDQDGSTGPDEQSMAEGMADEWRGKFRRLLATHPDFAQEVRRILDEELTPSLPGQTRSAPIVFHANPTGNARVYQAGRDQHIADR